MELKNYQQLAFDKILFNNKSFLCWGRQYGKTQLITHYIKHFVNNYHDRDILAISNNKRESKYLMNFIIDHAYTYIKKINIRYITFKNGNHIEFCADNFEYILRKYPGVIIYDDIYKKDTFLSNHINNNTQCKIIFTCRNIDLDILQYYDYFNDFYVNIMPGSKDIERKMFYKPKELVSCGNLLFERQEKLKNLKLLTNGI